MENLDNIKEIDMFNSSIDDSISEAYNNLYSCLELGNHNYILSRNDARDTLESMLDHFTSTEEYEKCSLIYLILKKCAE